MGSEDFAYMLKERPGSYFFLGSRVTGEENRSTPRAMISTTSAAHRRCLLDELAEPYLVRR